MSAPGHERSRQTRKSGDIAAIAAAVQAPRELGVKFKGINVLQDPSLREGIEPFSNWTTIPQLYVKGEFIGGCDIVREMFQSGELQQVLDEKGVASEVQA